jgi:hypothetical protein
VVSKTILLTGIPRSGTTLACSLLNQLPATLALVEPMDMHAFSAASDATARHDFITHYQQHVRAQLLASKQVRALVIEGEESNTFASNSPNEKRKTVISGAADILVAKAFSHDFTLVIKHPNAFSALLPELTQAWPCYAIIRNPLAVLASWNSLDHPLSRGRAPMAEAFDQELVATLDVQDSDLDRQLVLINWYFARYLRYLPADHIIAYEALVASGGRALAALTPAALELEEHLTSRNSNRIYNSDFIDQAASKLIASPAGASWREFYSDADIAALADHFTAQPIDVTASDVTGKEVNLTSDKSDRDAR